MTLGQTVQTLAEQRRGREGQGSEGKGVSASSPIGEDKSAILNSSGIDAVSFFLYSLNTFIQPRRATTLTLIE